MTALTVVFRPLASTTAFYWRNSNCGSLQHAVAVLLVFVCCVWLAGLVGVTLTSNMLSEQALLQSMPRPHN